MRISRNVEWPVYVWNTGAKEGDSPVGDAVKDDFQDPRVACIGYCA